MTATTKTVNYTDVQTAKMIAEYTANPSKATVEALAVAMGKTSRSIIAKLSREKVYVAPTRESKVTGGKPQSKDVIADAIGKVLNLTEPETEGLAKAPKTCLLKIFAALANSKPIDGND